LNAVNIMMLSSTFPYPPSRGGTEIRTFNLLKHLSQTHTIVLGTQRHPEVSDADVAALRDYVAELAIFPLRPSPRSSRSVRGMATTVGRYGRFVATGTPPNASHRYAPEMQAWVDERLASGQFGALTCEHSVNEIYVRPEFRDRLNTVVDVHSSVYGWTRNHLEAGASENVWRDRLMLPLLERYERRYSQKFATIVVTTPDDAAEMGRFAPDAALHVIPNGVDLELFPIRQGDPAGQVLAFVGAMDASHNIDAARFFALEVMPKLREQYPAAEFRIIGARPTPAVQALGDRPGIVVTGPVDSMVDQLHQATVCVVPLRTGFGIKNKTLEAMAAGVPVVGSDRGLEGLDVDGHKGSPLRALRANRVEDYVAAIARLFADAELRAQLSREARSLIESEYTWESAGDRYEQAVCGTA
jgi:glycosyltransferase involved in cell wall biosynthesis